MNALQSPDKRAFVSALGKGDVLLINRGGADALINDLFAVPSHSLKHALCSLLSILCSTGRGISYLTRNTEDMTTLEKIADILKDQDDGSVSQRFCIAAL